jgi:predicted GNAT family N-acyltransferase
LNRSTDISNSTSVRTFAFRGRKLGAVLLSDAIGRATRSEVMVHGVIVDAKDDEAAAFYQHFGFAMLNAEARQLVWPIQPQKK